jgi:hypothetical protein
MKLYIGGILYSGVAKVEFNEIDLSPRIKVWIEYEDGEFDEQEITNINCVHIEK